MTDLERRIAEGVAELRARFGELLTHDRRGYWEIRGYSNTAHPRRDDRMW